MSNPSVLSLLRARVKTPEAKKETPSPFDVATLRKAVVNDKGLSSSQRNELMNHLMDPEVIASLKQGAVGGLLGGLLGKFMKLSGETRLLLSLAGFGIGKILYDFKRNQLDTNSSRYNKSLKMYELD